MTGALVALTATGAHNRYTTAAPQQTLFKNAYRRHTGFAMTDRDNTFSGSLSYGQTVVAGIDRDADLVGQIAIDFSLPALVAADASAPANWADHIGHVLCEEVSFQVGGHDFVQLRSEWIEIWAQLSTPESKWEGYLYLIGHRSGLRTNTGTDAAAAASVYVPIPFYFCQSPKNYFPAISTQYHDLKLRLKIRAGASCVGWIDDTGLGGAGEIASAVTPTSLSAVVRTRYVYLTDDERRRFAYSAHEYLITQVQVAASQSVTGSTTETITLSCNHLVSGFYFVVRGDTATTNNQWFNFSTVSIIENDDATSATSTNGHGTGVNPVTSMQLSFNGSNLFQDARTGDYYAKYQNLMAHTRVPILSPGINAVHACLDAESIVSTGTWNMSRIERVSMNLVLGTVPGTTGTLLVFARSFNIARHINGLAGIAYSN